MNQTIDVVEWLQERAFRMYGPTMEAAHTKTKEWLWADEITRLRADLAAVTERMSKLDFERTVAESERDSLRAENKRMREALKPLAKAIKGQIADILFGEMPDNSTATVILQLGDLRAARAALEGVTEPASPKAETEFFVFDEFAPLPEPPRLKA